MKKLIPIVLATSSLLVSGLSLASGKGAAIASTSEEGSFEEYKDIASIHGSPYVIFHSKTSPGQKEPDLDGDGGIWDAHRNVLKGVQAFGGTIYIKEWAKVPLEKVIEAGYVRLVQFQHTHKDTGVKTWRNYDLDSSARIINAYLSSLTAAASSKAPGSADVHLKKIGKNLTDYDFFFKNLDGAFGYHHHGYQKSLASKKIRAFRIIWVKPDNSLEARISEEGLAAAFPKVDRSLTNGMAESLGEDLEEAIDDECGPLVYEDLILNAYGQLSLAESKKAERLATSPQEKLKFNRKLPRLLKQTERIPREGIVVAQWLHRTGYRAFRATDMHLLLSEHQKMLLTGKTWEVLLNTGKPNPETGEPGRLMSINLSRHPFTQTDLVTGNSRDVRFTKLLPGCKDTIYYMWLHMFPKAEAMGVYKIYNTFLDKISTIDLSQASSTNKEKIMRAEAEALEEIQALNASSLWCAPPQGKGVPFEFRDQLTGRLLKDPYVHADEQANPKAPRMDGTYLKEWFQGGKTTHPYTGDPARFDNFVPDAELKAKIFKWSSASFQAADEVTKALVPYVSHEHNSETAITEAADMTVDDIELD